MIQKFYEPSIGVNPRLGTTWRQLVNYIWKRLNSLYNKFVSLDGRTILLNSVLNSIHIFLLPLLKMHVKVWKNMVRHYRCFYWGGTIDKDKFAWVPLSDVCKLKMDGRMRVRDICLTYFVLLGKCTWRLLESEGL